jgi:hypothetical protein
MSVLKDQPVEVVFLEDGADELSVVTQGRTTHPFQPPDLPVAATAILHGFDVDERPQLMNVPGVPPGEIVWARTTVDLARSDVGSSVVVLFEFGDARRPIIVGVVRGAQPRPMPATKSSAALLAQVDDERLILTAEREIVLRCGNASLTLTRAGKVLINGTYVLSRSSGYNKIKGAAVDIN